MTRPVSPFSLYSLLALLIALFVGLVMSVFNPIYAILIAGVLVIVIILTLRLDEFFVTLIVATHILVDSYLGFALYQIALIMALVLLAVCYFWRSANRPWTAPRSYWLWLAFLVLNLVPMLEGGDFSLQNSFGYYLEVVFSAFIMFWLGNIIARDTLAVRRIFQCLAMLAALFAMHTIIEATTGKFLFESARAQASTFQIAGVTSRASSFFGNPNSTGMFLATSVFLPLGLFVESKRFWMKVLYLIQVLLILFAVLFTYSNGSWLATAAGAVVFIVLIGNLRYSLLFSLFLALLVGALFVLFPAQIAVQLSHAKDSDDLSLHLGAWQTAFLVMQANPWFGVGLGNQAYLIRSAPYLVPAQTKPLAEPDNSFLQWGAIAGIPVMLLFFALLSSVFWYAWRNWQAVDTQYRILFTGGIAALVALSVNSLTVDGWTSPLDVQFLGWLIAGVVATPMLGSHLYQQQLMRSGKKAETAYIQVRAS
jgi:O-antigen ligase